MDDSEIVMVTMAWEAVDGKVEELGATLARYVVLARGSDGCLNIDFGASIESPGRFVIVEKWHSPSTQRSHFASALVARLAMEAEPLLARTPLIDLCDAISVHDLR